MVRIYRGKTLDQGIPITDILEMYTTRYWLRYYSVRLSHHILVSSVVGKQPVMDDLISGCLQICCEWVYIGTAPMVAPQSDHFEASNFRLSRAAH